jgi:8-oxo-dGTP pyrophosphatase MutT (NUDIX family)
VSSEGSLGPEWVRSPDDGRYFRRAARVLLLDEEDRVLLVRGHDVDRPERSWWFTIGGGIDAGETPTRAAVRELAEETGLKIAETDLVGPVLTREAVFDFEAEHVRQDEIFYYARIRDAGEVSRDGWTDVERSFMDDVAWWSLDDLRQVDIEVFPHELADVVETLIAGWDGTVRHLGLQDDDATGEAVPQ